MKLDNNKWVINRDREIFYIIIKKIIIKILIIVIVIIKIIIVIIVLIIIRMINRDNNIS
jgi:hypothetical protein